MDHCLPNESQTLLLKACLTTSPEAVTYLNQWMAEIEINFNEISNTSLGLPQVYDKLDFGSQRLLCLLYFNFTSQKIDLPVIKSLKGYFKYVWLKNQIIREDLAKIANSFQKDNIDFIAFKGLSLVENYYPHPGTRPSVDLDLAVRLDQLDKVERSLSDANWSPKLNIQAITSLEKMLSHAITLVKDKQELDLHVRLTPFLLMQDTLELFWKKSVKVESGVKFLHHAHELYIIVLHGMDCNTVTNIRWVSDAVHIIKTFKIDDWKEFLELIKLEKYNSLIKYALQYLEGHQFVKIPPSIKEQLNKELRLNKSRSPFVKLMIKKRKVNDFKVFQAHYLTAKSLSSSAISRWRLIFSHYKEFWQVGSLFALAKHAVVQLFRKILHPGKRTNA